MKYFIVFLSFVFSIPSISQTKKIPLDTMVVTNHTAVIKNKSISYQATTGTQPVWDKTGQPTATLYYTYYERSDIKDKTSRHKIFSSMG